MTARTFQKGVFDDLVVTGCTGSVLAERVASVWSRRVSAAQCRAHPAGNAFGEDDERGPPVHRRVLSCEEPYDPASRPENRALYAKRLADERNATFRGRLGVYWSGIPDQGVARALQTSQTPPDA